MKTKASKNIAEIIPEGAYQENYGDFIETLERILGRSRFDIFSRRTFDLNARRQVSNKQWVPALWLFSASFLALGVFLTPVNVVYVGFSLIVAAAFFTYGWRFKKKPSTEKYNKLMEGATDAQVARIILDWGAAINLGSVALYQEVRSSITEVPPKHRSGPNMAMVLLGDDTHRQALGINKRIPETPYLYSRPDRDKIFQPLIDALSETKQYGHFKRDIKLVFTPEPPTVKTTQQSRPIDTPSTKVKVDARKKSAIKRGTFYAKPTPKSRDYKHFQIVLSRRDMMALIIEYSDTEDYIEYVETNPTRKRWMKVFQYIYKNWELWGKYRSNPNQHRNFSKVLFGPDMLDYKSDEVKKKKAFREGKHREMSDFIIECYEIPVSEFSKSEQIELF